MDVFFQLFSISKKDFNEKNLSIFSFFSHHEELTSSLNEMKECEDVCENLSEKCKNLSEKVKKAVSKMDTSYRFSTGLYPTSKGNWT